MPNIPPAIVFICGISLRKIHEPMAAVKGTMKIKLLALLALITLALKTFFEFRNKRQTEKTDEHRST